jgi:3-deoxy-manno-octulosonate cytidylyltransferase (CMP-KDO synthetase)
MKAICVIPARYASQRLPGKPLAIIGHKPMIQWVYEQAAKAKNIDKVIVATDSEKVIKVVEGFSGFACMTDPNLPSGTDRVYAAIENEQAEIIINLQGDEPFVSPDLLDDLVRIFSNKKIEIATPIKQIENENELHNPNVVGVVRDIHGYALYFSRATIPWVRDKQDIKKWLHTHIFYKHIGIYAYRKKCLKKLTLLKQSSLEKSEKLEQLRFLENGYKIYTLVTEYNSIGVDTPEDLHHVNELLKSKNEKMVRL